MAKFRVLDSTDIDVSGLTDGQREAVEGLCDEDRLDLLDHVVSTDRIKNDIEEFPESFFDSEPPFVFTVRYLEDGTTLRHTKVAVVEKLSEYLDMKSTPASLKQTKVSNEDEQQKEKTKNIVNAWIAEKNRHSLSADEQKVYDWLYQSQNEYNGTGWMEIAKKPENKEYMDKWKTKQPEGKRRYRQLSEHIRGKCRELLEKIMKDNGGR